MEDAAVNQAEKKALRVLLKHLRWAWQTSAGLPTDADIKKLLALVRIESISVESGGTEETAAKSLLRQAVLQDPIRADDIPVGEYTLMAWHPGIGTMLEMNVTVSAQQTLQADFTFESPKGRRSVHEITENPHFDSKPLGNLSKLSRL